MDWAGGLVNWEALDVQTNGYYYASFESVTISCYNATKGPGTNNGVSYTYNGYAGTNDTVVDGKDPTVLASFQGTGTDMDAGKPSGTASAARVTGTAESIPGMTGGNPAGIDSHSSPSEAAGTISPEATGGGSGSGFSQGSGYSGSDSTKNGADTLGAQEKVLKGSLFAGIVAVIAMMAL